MNHVMVLLHGSANGSHSWRQVRSALTSQGLSEAETLIVPGAAHMIPLTHAAAVVVAVQREVKA